MQGFVKKLRKILKKLVHNPWVDFSVGGVLLISGLWEAWETLPQDLANANINSSHGIIIFGIITALKAIAEMFGGLEFMDEAEYIEEKRKSN